MEGPVMFGYQLLGDSHMVRLGAHLGWRLAGVRPARIGLCVSGQKVIQLRRLVDDHGYFARPVIVLIGSNDLRNDCLYHTLRADIHCLIMKLRVLAPGVTFLTIPPVPAIWSNVIYRRHVLALGRWLHRYNRWGFRVVDITTPFLLEHGGVDVRFFERYMGKGNRRRLDVVHINQRRMEVVMECLLASLITDFPSRGGFRHTFPSPARWGGWQLFRELDLLRFVKGRARAN